MIKTTEYIEAIRLFQVGAEELLQALEDRLEGDAFEELHTERAVDSAARALALLGYAPPVKVEGGP